MTTTESNATLEALLAKHGAVKLKKMIDKATARAAEAKHQQWLSGLKKGEALDYFYQAEDRWVRAALVTNVSEQGDVVIHGSMCGTVKCNFKTDKIKRLYAPVCSETKGNPF